MIKKIVAAAVAAACFASSAHAATNLVTNGDFEQTTNGLGQMGTQGVTNATGWITDGYNFIMDGSVDSTGVTGYYGNLQLWGPANGSANGFTTSPAGGNFLGADGAYWVGGVSQLISGLVPGQQYAVTFYWAADQQFGYTGAQTEQWEVDLGSESQSTAVYDNTSHGFSGWMKETFTFTATSAQDYLTFVAHGTP